ncbi:MAG: nucleotide sugar dehydrogenase [Planctomycetales bacterium]|nr:nucleotide sugar dehydrogenase [Planctomycetales bacterium]
MSITLTHTDIVHELHEKITLQTAQVGVVGLGYVGLPLLNAFINAGFNTIGFDVDPNKISQLQSGSSYIKHIPSEWISRWLRDERFSATSDMSRLREADVVIICVPTPLNESRDPDLSYIESTARSISEHLRPGQLVVLESTTYPGTTRDVLLPILSKSGLTLGKDYFVAYSPEREDPGNVDFSTTRIPKVVGGVDVASRDLAASLYGNVVVDTVPVSSCEVAEACKILENTYRSVNIAMVNELKVLFTKIGIDIWEVIDAAKTKPFGYQAFYPGPGLGGHCIPIDPFYLSWLARKNELSTRFIELAGEVNTNMPPYVIERVAEALNDVGKPIRGSKIGVLGVAYKKDVDDPRESPSFKLMELLIKRGAYLSYNDPHISTLPSMRHYDVPRLASENLSPEWLASQDCILIATDHSAYDWELIARHSKLIVDTRNACKNVVEAAAKIYKA